MVFWKPRGERRGGGGRLGKVNCPKHLWKLTFLSQEPFLPQHTPFSQMLWDTELFSPLFIPPGHVLSACKSFPHSNLDLPSYFISPSQVSATTPVLVWSPYQESSCSSKKPLTGGSQGLAQEIAALWFPLSSAHIFILVKNHLWMKSMKTQRQGSTSIDIYLADLLSKPRLKGALASRRTWFSVNKVSPIWNKW